MLTVRPSTSNTWHPHPPTPNTHAAQVEVANFEVASDAFSTFKDLLTRHKAAVAQFLADHYQRFFDAFYSLLQSSNYVTRRQSLKVRVHAVDGWARGRGGGCHRGAARLRPRGAARCCMRHCQARPHRPTWHQMPPSPSSPTRPLQLLGELPLDGINVRLTMRYVSHACC